MDSLHNNIWRKGGNHQFHFGPRQAKKSKSFYKGRGINRYDKRTNRRQTRSSNQFAGIPLKKT